MQYVSNPVKIEAFQFTDKTNPLKFPTWFLKYSRVISMREARPAGAATADNSPLRLHFQVKTKNGWIAINEGDFAIYGGDEVYPCPPDVFNKKYEAVK